MRGAPTKTNRVRAWLLYAAFWLAVGLFLGIADLQHYLARGGQHPWEPFLWELSSSAVAGSLAVLVFRWHDRLQARPLWQRVAGHVLGAVGYCVFHPALMYAIRFAVYAFTPLRYDSGSALSILAYEAAKDVVTYTLMVALAHGYLAYRRSQQLAAELTAARLSRLQEQIQPHFLFNTLHLVSSVMYEDVERADEILSQLAALLRQSLATSERSTHRLAEEMRVVEPFLAITERRFGSRLQIRIAVSDDAAACEIPSLLLIAPVENAIKHGVARTSGAVEIVVTARVEGGMLLLDVSDSAGQLEDARTDGIGLVNTRARLAALYGAAASVDLAREAATTVLRMRLPARVAA